MKQIFDMCEEQDIEIPDEKGMKIPLYNTTHEAITEYRSDGQAGFEVDIRKLPPLRKLLVTKKRASRLSFLLSYFRNGDKAIVVRFPIALPIKRASCAKSVRCYDAFCLGFVCESIAKHDQVLVFFRFF